MSSVVCATTDVEASVARALEDIPEAFRTVLVLVDIESLTYREVADALGCPIGTVMSRLHRGRKAMQKALIDFATERGLLERTPEPDPH